MIWSFKEDRPIYAQLIEHIEVAIISGSFKPGDKMPSVRELASEAGVNPNTMQRALAELEQNKLLYAQRTAGRYVTEDEDIIASVKKEIALKHIEEFLYAMGRLGFNAKEALKEAIETINNSEQKEG